MKPMKPSTVTILCLTCFVFIWLAGCTPNPVTQPTALPVATTPPPQSTVTPQSTASLSPTATPTIDWYREDCYLITEWTRFQHPETGMYIDIPLNWRGYLNDYNDDVTFRNPEETCGLSVDMYTVSSDEFEQVLMPPSSYSGKNEGGYESVWEQPFESPPWRGWKYIWGIYGKGRSTPAPGDYTGQGLTLSVLDESNGWCVRLDVNWDYESHMLAQEVGFEEVIAERFSFLEHMLMSVEFLD